MREERQRLANRGKPVLDRSADLDGACTSRLQLRSVRIGTDSWRVAVAFMVVTVAVSVSGCTSSSPSSASARDRATSPAQQLTRSAPVTPTGVGPLVVGMTYNAAERLLGASLVIDDYADTGGSCVAVSFSGAASTLSGIGAEGRLRRVEVDEPGWKTATGIGIGSTERQVRAAYPVGLTSEPHSYDSNGHYLVYAPSHSKDSMIIFETNGKRVTSFRVGEPEFVKLIEGCL